MLLVKPTELSVTICLYAITFVIHVQVYADLQSRIYIYVRINSRDLNSSNALLEFRADAISPNVLRIFLASPPP